MAMLIQIFRLLPMIIAAVKAIEEAIPISGQGAAKLDLVLDIIRDVGGDITGIIPVVTKVIARIVGLFNQTGTFKTTTPTVTP